MSSTRSSSPSSLTSSPSISASSISDATSVSTSTRKLVVLPSPAFAEPKILEKVTAGLEGGSGDLVVLVADARCNVNDVLKRLGAEWGGDESLAMFVPGTAEEGWGVVECEGMKYWRNHGEGCETIPTIDFNIPAPTKTSSKPELLNTFALAGLRSVYALPDGRAWVLERAVVSFPSLYPPHVTSRLAIEGAALPSPWGIPTPADWRALWAAWDAVTLGMIPRAMLHQKPIDLRHKCLFYIGHIPTFLDMLLSKTLREPFSEPRYFKDIFERGIDPNIDDPEHCHPHSQVPTRDEDWPTLETILAFRDTVRARLMSIFKDVEEGRRVLTRRLARTVVLCLEHEGFHVETLLYMLIQRAGTGTIPPPTAVPRWDALAKQWDATPPPTTDSVTIEPTTVVMGHDDQESEDLLEENALSFEGHEFGWDNESPRRAVEVGAFRAEWRPVSNAEFRAFWEGKNAEGNARVMMPASWVVEEGEVKVRTLYGPVPFHVAQHWPVLTSYDNLEAYAKNKGGRLPSEPELRVFLDRYEVGYEGGGNVGFRNWHSVPATAGVVDVDGGRGSNGGVWEWTSTKFDGHEGLDPTSLFTGYSTDFFDGVHHVVLGASYATIPRQAGRRTLRNFYQHNYPYPWVAGRVVYDV